MIWDFILETDGLATLQVEMYIQLGYFLIIAMSRRTFAGSYAIAQKLKIHLAVAIAAQVLMRAFMVYSLSRESKSVWYHVLNFGILDSFILGLKVFGCRDMRPYELPVLKFGIWALSGFIFGVKHYLERAAICAACSFVFSVVFRAICFTAAGKRCGRPSAEKNERAEAQV